MSGTHFSGPVHSENGFVINGSSVAKVAVVEITSAELLALNATPKTLIAAPSSTEAHIVTGVEFYKPAGTAYAGIAVGEDITLKYTDGSGTVVSGVETTGFLDQTTAEFRVAFPQDSVGSVTAEVEPTAGAAVVAHLLTGEITTGDTSLFVKVYYRTVDTVLSV